MIDSHWHTSFVPAMCHRVIRTQDYKSAWDQDCSCDCACSLPVHQCTQWVRYTYKLWHIAMVKVPAIAARIRPIPIGTILPGSALPSAMCSNSLSWGTPTTMSSYVPPCLAQNVPIAVAERS